MIRRTFWMFLIKNKVRSRHIIIDHCLQSKLHVKSVKLFKSMVKLRIRVKGSKEKTTSSLMSCGQGHNDVNILLLHFFAEGSSSNLKMTYSFTFSIKLKNKNVLCLSKNNLDKIEHVFNRLQRLTVNKSFLTTIFKLI